MTIYRLYDINKKYFEIKIDRVLILNTIIAIIPILLIYYLSSSMTLYILGILIAIIYAYAINRKNLKAIFNMVIKRK